MPALPPILLDLDAWAAATAAARHAAAVAATGQLPAGVALQGLAVHSLGGQSHEVATFQYDDAQFVLLPGHPRAALGYDRSRAFVPTAAQAEDWKFTEDEYGVKLEQYLDQSTSPLRRLRVAPFLVEVAARNFDYGCSGDEQDEAYRDVLEACGPGFRLPTCDEWEYACAAGTRSLFRWGDDTPRTNSYDEKAWDLHKRPNAFGLLLNSSTYDCEICQGPKFRGGDGGASVCGGMGNLASWLPLASSFQASNEEVEGWFIDDVHVRRVRSLGT